jgi:putative colanic acid biosynthesis acetyltransferase WcaF
MQTQSLDISANRNSDKYTATENLRRVFWSMLYPFFRFSPRICFRWRAFLLRLFGAKIGKNVNIYNTAVIYLPWNLEIGEWSAIGECAYIYNLGKITIGRQVTISQRAHLCAGTHDFTKRDMPLIKPPIFIGDQAWVCADAFVGPNVTVGMGAVIGARAVVTEDTSGWAIVAGNPARTIGKREIFD